MSRTDEVVDGIRRMIMNGDLSAGERLPVEKDLCAQLGVSRGPLREGIRALSILGVVETRQGDGTYVTSLDAGILLAPVNFIVDLHGAANAANFHVVRRVLETESAGLAARRIDAAGLATAASALEEAGSLLAQSPIDHQRLMEFDVSFHRAIAAGCGEPVLAALIEALVSTTVRGRLWRALTEGGAQQRTHEEHSGILRAIADGDPERARIRMAAHLLEVQEYVQSLDPAPPSNA